MAEKISQAFLLRNRSKIKDFTNPIKIKKEQINYLFNFCSENKSKIYKIIINIFLISFLQIFLLISSDIFIKKYSYLLNLSYLYSIFFVIFCFSIIYVFLYFLYIKNQKLLSLKLINQLRRQWLILYLKKNILNFKNSDKSELFTKISYHLSILQMGIENAGFLFIESLIIYISLVIASFFIDSKLLILVLFSLAFYLLIGFFSYKFSRKFISNDQTLYSRILRFICDIFNEFDQMKLNKKEQSVLSDLDKMVAIDNDFRLKREILINLSNKIIFIILILLSSVFYIIEIYYPFFETENSLNYLIYFILFALLIKLIYSSNRIGLFAYPFYLGIHLCISEKFPLSGFVNHLDQKFQEIVFKSDKVKLNPDLEYKKDLKYIFKKGERVLFVGQEGSGKTHLAYLFAGLLNPENNKSWIIKIDDEKMMYKFWNRKIKNIFLISQHAYTEMSIFDIFNEFNQSQNKFANNLELLIKNISQYPELKFILQYKKLFAKKISKTEFSIVDNALIQMAYCIVKKPPIIIIDNLWIDINHSKINEMLKAIDKYLTNAIIISFSKADNEVIKYDKKYYI